MNKRKSSTSTDEKIAEQNVERLTESDVFITEYVDRENSFNGILKHRFSDFQVHEIDYNGEVVQLTRLASDFIIEDPKIDENEFEYHDIDVNEKPTDKLEYPIHSKDQWKQLYLLLKRNIAEEKITIEVTNLIKPQRTLLHQEIQSKFRDKLFTTTVSINDQKFISITTNKNVDGRNNNNWPQDLPQYLHFVLYKENIDTLYAADRVRSKLHVKQKYISYAGTKDRRGVTTQWMSARFLKSNKLVSPFAGMQFGHFKYEDSPLKLGQLKGNKFDLALRNVESNDSEINETLNSLGKNGFINYYGLQRFGTCSAVPTYEIGRALVSKQWKKAVDLILKSRFNGKNEVSNVLKIWSSTSDASAAFEAVNKKYRGTIEGKMLKTLATQGNTAYVNAIQTIPRNIVLLYLHSLQSLIWNRIVSRRIREFGLKPLVGDLVYFEKCSIDVFSENESDFVKKVRAISVDEVDEVKIEDIVYPLPGSKITYPNNVISTWYDEILAEYKVDFTTITTNKMIQLAGDYRNIVIVPQNMNWKIVRYNDKNTDLILTDLQKLKNEGEIKLADDGAYKAAILEFCLPTCTYASMLFREITKTESSSHYQASLTVAHINKKPKLEKLD